mmetsp:Transcript_26667/g.64229  ORF Transcript_26667/g.64229 Transcript_26667/m.64229 type:complete len:703 (+) Transcript_26667:104-2212(+)
MRVLLGSACLVAASSSPTHAGFVQQYEMDLNVGSRSPIKRIVKLLTDMKSQLEADMAEDKKMYAKMQCWCNTGATEKSESVDAAQQKIAALKSDIEAGKAGAAGLQEKLASIGQDVESNKNALGTAEKQRSEEKATFQSYEKEAIANIEALKGALLVLQKLHPEASTELLQVKDDPMYDTSASPAQSTGFLSNSVPLVLTSEALVRLKDVLPKKMQDKEEAAKVLTYLGQMNDPNYANQSGEIFGIMKQLLDQMQRELSEAQAKEAEASADFLDLRHAKESEVAAGEEAETAKTEQLAETKKKVADDTEDLTDTEDALSADQKFLLNLKKTCGNLDTEYATRSEDRHNELSAVADALEILTSEEAQTLTSFVQQSSLSTMKMARARAVNMLMRAGAKTGNPELSTLAMQVKLDAFTKVKAAMDQMLAALKQEQSDEVKQKDFCNQEFHTNEMETNTKSNEKEDLEQKLTDLDGSISSLSDDIAALGKQIADARLALKQASEQRVTENQDYLKGMQEQTLTRNVLKQATERLLKAYGFIEVRSGQPASVEESYTDSRANPNAASPNQFGEYKKNGNSKAVVALLQKFIAETVTTEQEMQVQEQDAQAAYEQLVTETNESVNQKAREIVNKQELKAQAEQDQSQAKQDEKQVEHDLEELNSYVGQLHKSCDWILENFDARQSARTQEMESIRSAKAILSGAMQG